MARDRGEQCPIATGDRANNARIELHAVIFETYGEVAEPVGAHDSGTGSLEGVHRLGCRMPVPVAGSDAHERYFRPQDAQRAIRYRDLAPVMPDLQHIDVADRALLHKSREHIILCISCEQRREPARLHKKNDARFVLGRVLDGTIRRHDIDRHVADPEARPRCHRLERPAAPERLDVVRARPRGYEESVGRQKTPETLEAARVVGVHVSQHYGVDVLDPAPGKGINRVTGRRPRVDENGVGSVSDEHHVALTDVEDRDRCTTPRTRNHQGDGDCSEQYPQPPRDPRVGLRPPEPHRDAEDETADTERGGRLERGGGARDSGEPCRCGGGSVARGTPGHRQGVSEVRCEGRDEDRRESREQNHGDERTGDHVRSRRDERHHAEDRGGDRRSGQLGRDGECDRFTGALEEPGDRRAHPRACQASEQQQTSDSGDREPEADIERGRRVRDKTQHDRRRQRGQWVGATSTR